MPQADGGVARQGKYFWYSLEVSITEIYGCRGLYDQSDELDYCLSFTYEARKPSNITRTCEGRTAKGKRICKATCGAETCNY